jgi:hypothetical protein
MGSVSDEWSTIDASDRKLAGVEQQGLHAHEWYRSDSEPRTWLFKPARQERHRAFGEDIAEKLASELARLLAVPAARVELATRGEMRGVLVEDARPPDWALQHGQVLMGEAVEDYNPDDREHRGHAPQAIRTALERFGSTPSSDLPAGFGAFDAFAGYLIFDALIAQSTVTTETGPFSFRLRAASPPKHCARHSTTLRVSASRCRWQTVPNTWMQVLSHAGRLGAGPADSNTPAGHAGSRW